MSERLTEQEREWLQPFATGEYLCSNPNTCDDTCTEHLYLGDVVERILSDRLAECAEDHGSWREEIADLKSDVQMWKSVAAAAEARGAQAVRERVEAHVREFVAMYDVEHNEGCEGEPDCIACVLLDVRRTVRDHFKPCGGINANVCVGEGCYGESCLRAALSDPGTSSEEGNRG